MHPGFTPGRPDWAPDSPPELTRTVRLWPHHVRGEGHYIAKLGRPTSTGESGTPPSRSRAPRRGTVPDREKGGARVSTGPRGAPRGARTVAAAWRGFVADALERDLEEVTVVGERAYLVPDAEVAEAGVRLVRPGLLVGRARPGRFEPAHALGMAAGVVAARRVRVVDARAWMDRDRVGASAPSRPELKQKVSRYFPTLAKG